MKENYFNQRIACYVFSCKYYDSEEEKCSLGQIVVRSGDEQETMCESFKKAS